jgi:exosortase A-associated hydrolase 1
MNYSETATTFACAGETLVGILTKPETAESTGIVIIVGGPQYRVGSHRQFVHLARALASAGYPVLRFDYRGMGDSTGTQRDFQDASADIDAAITQLQHACPSVRKTVLWGLCDAASAALLYCHEHKPSRVTGLCLVNPWVRSTATLARTRVKHYYVKRLGEREFWLKLLSGKVAASAVSHLWQNIQQARSSAGQSSAGAAVYSLPFQTRMAKAWDNFAGGILLLLSEDDYTAKEFVEYAKTDEAWSRTFGHERLVRFEVLGADHTFSHEESRRLAEQRTLNWLDNGTQN